MYDNMDVGQIVNFLAANTIVGNTDCCHKNYYFYRDSGQSGGPITLSTKVSSPVV
jgi:spore coat protein CotH